MDAARTARPGTSEQQVVACLGCLREDRGLKPGTKNGPDQWSWFKTTVKDYFRQMRARQEAADPMGLYSGEVA
jgi:hypothetical protein